MYRYKLLSSKIRFIEVDVPFLFPSLSGKDILLWFTISATDIQAPEADVKLLKVLCFFKSQIHHKNLYCCKNAHSFPSHLESQKSRWLFKNSQMNSSNLVSILILSHQPRETSVPPLTQNARWEKCRITNPLFSCGAARRWGNPAQVTLRVKGSSSDLSSVWEAPGTMTKTF